MADLKTNSKQLLTNYTTYVLIGLGAAASWWLGLPVDEQAKYLALYPWLKWLAPLAGVASVVVARVLPQYTSDQAKADPGPDTEPQEHA